MPYEITARCSKCKKTSSPLTTMDDIPHGWVRVIIQDSTNGKSLDQLLILCSHKCATEAFENQMMGQMGYLGEADREPIRKRFQECFGTGKT